jgi:site-specific DNA recombinase
MPKSSEAQPQAQKRAITYARVSTADQLTNTSIPGQIESCRKYAAQNGLTILEEITEDFSGTVLERPGLQKAMGYLRDHEAQVLLVTEQDRLSRDLVHTLLLMQEAETLGGEIAFVNQPRERSAEGDLLLKISGVFKEYERAKIKERTQRGKANKARMGGLLASRFLPLGYRHVKDERGFGTYEVIEEEAELVRQLFHMVAEERKPLYEITMWLNKSGIRTKNSGMWYQSTVRRIIQNEVYKGQFHWNKTRGVPPDPARARTKGVRKKQNSSVRYRDKNELDSWIPITVPAIISEEQWERAQRQLELAAARAPRNNTQRFYLLRGRVKCGECGRMLVGMSPKSRQAVYSCSGKNLSIALTKENQCKSRRWNAEYLEGTVFVWLAHTLTNRKKLEELLAAAPNVQRDQRERDETELARIERTEQELSREQQKWMDLRLRDSIDDVMLQDAMIKIRERRAGLDAVKHELQERLARTHRITATVSTMSGTADGQDMGAFVAFLDMRYKDRDRLVALMDAMDLKVEVDSEHGDINMAGNIGPHLAAYLPTGLLRDPGGGSHIGSGGGREEPLYNLKSSHAHPRQRHLTLSSLRDVLLH